MVCWVVFVLLLVGVFMLIVVPAFSPFFSCGLCAMRVSMWMLYFLRWSRGFLLVVRCGCVGLYQCFLIWCFGVCC